MGIEFHHWRTKFYCDVGPNRWYLFGGRDRDAQDSIQGMTAAGLLIDEATLIRPEFWNQAQARLSVPHAKIIATMNPASPRHFFKREVLDAVAAGDRPGLIITSTLRDNPYLADDVVDMLESSFTGHYKARMIDAQWASAAGLVFPSAQPVEGEPPELVEYDLGVDHGTANPTAALLFGRDRQGKWHTADSYYWPRERPQIGDPEHADGIVAMLAGRPLSRCIIDPTAATLRIELQRRGLPVRRGNASYATGVQALDLAFTTGFLKVYEGRAPDLVHELDGLYWDERAQERGQDKPVAGEDHAVDAARLWVMSRKPPPPYAGTRPEADLLVRQQC